MYGPARSVIADQPQGFQDRVDKAWLVCLAMLRVFDRDSSGQRLTHPATEEQLALIARAAERERAELENPKPYRYQERLDWNWGSETRSVIETAEGRADRIVLFKGEPLSPEQQAKQQHRLEKLLSDRDTLKNELKDQKSETQRRIRIVKAFPRAFFFDYAGIGERPAPLQFSSRPGFLSQRSRNPNVSRNGRLSLD